jgi:serine/threonine-protein phosphatase 2A regulatory subunit B''
MEFEWDVVVIILIQMKSNKIDWVESLKKFVGRKKQRTAQEIDDETDQLFLKYIEDAKKVEEESDPSYAKIPKFYQKSQASENPLAHKVRQEARNRFLKHKSSEVLEKADLEKIFALLKEHVSPPLDGKERINYNSFLTIASHLPLKCRYFFSASTFLKFDRDEYGRIDVNSFFHSIVRKSNLFQTRIHISLYDEVGNGYLREKDLEDYIKDIISSFKHLENMEDSFSGYYTMTAARKFFFFLDPKRTGRIYIKDMLTSPILAELYELRNEKSSPEELNNNWFSMHSAYGLYEKYLKLDSDNNGLLKREELAKYSWGITSIVIDRVFEEYHTFNGEIDYKGFLDFVLAVDNKKTNQAIQYFWRALDVYHKGAIDTFVINMFFRSIIDKLQEKGKSDFHVEDIKDEMFDMAKPKLSNVITLQDIISCGQGEIIIANMIDAKAFFEYDQRDSGTVLEVY